MKTFVMTAGELDYAAVFWFRELTNDNRESVDLNHLVMSCILWVVFVIVMPVLFANLLVSTLVISNAIQIN